MKRSTAQRGGIYNLCTEGGDKITKPAATNHKDNVVKYLN